MNKAFVINLDSQEELFREVQQEFLPYGVECERFVVTPDGNKQIGCTITHLDLIAKAKDKGWPYVIVLEDDCTAREAMKAWPALSQFLLQERKRWDIFLGGALYVHPKKLQTQFKPIEVEMIECLHAVTAHFIIYNQSSYDRMLQWHDLPQPLNERPNIDHLFDKYQLRTWVSSPGIAWQKPRPGCDWTEHFQHAEDKLRYFSQSLRGCLKYRLFGRWFKTIS
ncbi:MAG TPA: glycosyltransferase family 25 protein [Chthoniobacterales bacterium]|nr:glycosyltransferase family 25 protein [Chthoniobacterales bacterium]